MSVLDRLGPAIEEHHLPILRLGRIAQTLLTTGTRTAQLLAALEANPFIALRRHSTRTGQPMPFRAIARALFVVIAKVAQLEACIALLLLVPKFTRIDMPIRIGKARVAATHAGICQVPINAAPI